MHGLQFGFRCDDGFQLSHEDGRGGSAGNTVA